MGVKQDKRVISRVRLTGGEGNAGRGGAAEVAASLDLSLPLEIAVDGVVAVIFDGVGLKTSAIGEDWRTVSSSSTSIVYCLLKDLLAHPISTQAIVGI